MTAEVEEMVGGADRLPAEDLLPDLGDPPFRRGGGRHEPVGGPLVGRRRRESRPVELAVAA